jgi:hypothetical protein
MRKLILTISLFTIILISVNGQSEIAFNSVPVLNGKVVFEYFIPTETSVTPKQGYVKLQKWVRDKYRDNQIVSGIRFDDKGHFVTVSARTNFNNLTTMNYRLDTSVTGAGCMIVVRDITYQRKADDSSFFPKVVTAEQTITDQAINSGGDDKKYRDGIRTATLSFLNEIYSEINSLF